MRRAERHAFMVGALGLVASGIGWITMPGEFAHAWLGR